VMGDFGFLPSIAFVSGGNSLDCVRVTPVACVRATPMECDRATPISLGFIAISSVRLVEDVGHMTT